MVDHVPEGPLVPHVVAGAEALQRRIGESLGSRLSARGIRVRGSHGRILSLIGDGVRPSVLAEGWISKQAIGQRIRELQELGLVVVEHDPDDRRATVVRRTAKGETMVRVLAREIAGLEREMRDEVGAARYAVFREVLDELVSGHLPPALHQAE